MPTLVSTHRLDTVHCQEGGLKIFGEASAKTVVKKMKQVHDQAIIKPHLANMLT
jgi:hypothetical protein